MPTTEERFIDTVEARPGVSATELAKWLGVSRPYVYELAQKCGYARIEKRWVTRADVEQRGDSMYRMLSEVHEAVVSGIQRDKKGREIVELEPGETKSWSILTIEGMPHFVVPIGPVTEKNRTEAYRQMAIATEADGRAHRKLTKEQNREALSIFAGLAALQASDAKN